MILNIIILLVILTGLTLHRYLTPFWEQKMLPYPIGFLFFANLSMILYIINFIWMFGIMLGTIISVLTFFQVLYATLLWPFLLPGAIIVCKKPHIPKVNLWAYGVWSIIVSWILISLTIGNFLISDYMSLTKVIMKFFDNNYLFLTLAFVGVILVGNLIRGFTLKKFLKT